MLHATLMVCDDPTLLSREFAATGTGSLTTSMPDLTGGLICRAIAVLPVGQRRLLLSREKRHGHSVRIRLLLVIVLVIMSACCVTMHARAYELPQHPIVAVNECLAGVSTWFTVH